MSPIGQGSEKQPTIRPTEYRCYIKEDFLYATAGAVTPSRISSFVLRATPRPGGTSREVSYSVPDYHTTKDRICKYLFPKKTRHGASPCLALSAVLQLLLGKLQGIKVVIAAFLLQKLLMVALLQDLTVGQ